MSVRNESNETVFVKQENSSKLVAVRPGENWVGRQDGVKAHGSVYKTVNSVDVRIGSRPGDVEFIGPDIPVVEGAVQAVQDSRGGELLSPPDSDWDPLFNAESRAGGGGGDSGANTGGGGSVNTGGKFVYVTGSRIPQRPR